MALHRIYSFSDLNAKAKLDIYVHALPKLKDVFTLLTPTETQMMRGRGISLSKTFRRVSGFEQSDYDVHHKIPLCLGGNITDDNLVMAEPNLHDAIHRYINNQMRFMEPDEQRIIEIPYVPQEVWETDMDYIHRQFERLNLYRDTVTKLHFAAA